MKSFTKKLKRCGQRLVCKSVKGLILCLLVCGGTARLHAQVAQQLLGQVTDTTGAVVANAAVSVTNQNTGVDYPARTSQSGDWVVPYLQPGTYTVKVEAPGFQSFTQIDVTLDVGQLRSVNTVLSAGATTQQVTVTANALALDTSSADRGEVINGTNIDALPFNSRNVMVSTIPVAGVGSKNGLNNQAPYGNITNGLVVNSSALSLNIDGVNNMSTGFQTMAYLPLADTVQEVDVDTTGYDAAAVGFATAGNIDVHLKSGTNTFHGTVYEYYKSTGLDANSYQNNYMGKPRNSHKSNQYGFELGGPVIIPHFYDGHNKTFFTMAFEDYHNLTPANVTASVPGVLNEPSWLTPVGGYYQFPGLVQASGAPITLYDPASPNPAARVSFQREGAPNGYSIPASRVNQAAINILKYFPAPNVISSGSAPWQNNYFAVLSVPSIYKNFMIKVDHNLSEKDRFAARWGWWQQFQTTNSNGFPTGNPAVYGQFPNGQRFQTFMGEWVHILNANAIFDFKASLEMDQAENKIGPAFNQSSLGLPDVSGGVTQPSLLGIFPQVNLSSFVQMGGSGYNAGAAYGNFGANGTTISVHNTFSMLPSLTLTHGPHVLHVGLDNREIQISTKLAAGGLAITSNQQWTQASNANTADASSGLSIASLMLDNGYLSGGTLVQPAQAFETYHYYGAFAQDNYRVVPKLTLTLGLRYDFPSQAVERHNRYNCGFNPTALNPVSNAAITATGGLTFCGVDGTPRTQIPRAWYLFEPRFGFAYSYDTKTVIRGGVGGVFNWAAYTGSQTGFSATSSITPSPTTLFTTPTSTLANPFPGGYVTTPGASLGYLAGVGGGVSFYNHATRFGETWGYSLGVERQLTRGDVLDVSYVGKNFTKGPTGDAINRPSAGWAAQCNAEIGGNPALCTASNATNPFQGVNGFQGTSFYTVGKVQGEQLNLPFPQFTTVSESGLENNNGLWLNSFQVTETHRFANSLTSKVTYAYSRIMDNNGWLDYTYRVNARIEDSNDLNHRITFTGVYQLPFGTGHTFFGNANRIVDAAVGGWKAGALYIYESGRPWQPQCGTGQGNGLAGSTSCIETPFGVAPIKTKRTTVAGSPSIIRGAVPCVADRNPTTGAIIPRAGAIAYGCTQSDIVYKTLYAPVQQIVSTGIRLGSTSEFDANLSKSFSVFENYAVVLKMDAFNAINHAVWNNSYQTTNDINFGTILKGPTAQGNNPRQVQISAALRF